MLMVVDTATGSVTAAMDSEIQQFRILESGSDKDPLVHRATTPQPKTSFALICWISPTLGKKRAASWQRAVEGLSGGVGLCH